MAYGGELSIEQQDAIAKAGKTTSTVGAGAFSGATQAAQMTAGFGPQVQFLSTLAGGVGGALMAKAQDKALAKTRTEQAELAIDQENKLRYISDQAALQSFPSEGISGAPEMYKDGGVMKSKMQYLKGGRLKRISSSAAVVEGRAHENGGVLLDKNTEVEGGETILKDKEGTFVFSEALGFAKEHKKIANMIGRLEKKPKKEATLNAIKRLKDKEQKLKYHQEQYKAQQGIENDLDEMKYGGGV
jgi:hypothetical protein